MKLATTRGLTIEISATACAFAKAASVAALSPIGTSNKMLPGLSDQTCAAPGLTALAAPDAAGSAVQLTAIASIDRVCDDEGYGVADMAHLVLRQDRIRWHGEGIDFEIEQARQAAEILHV